VACGFVRSPHPHAAIRGIDAQAALALPGVHAVLTLDDLAPVMLQRRMLRHSNSGTPLDRFWSFALADGEVSYVGEAVAIVLADSRYLAEDAAARVAVDYDLLPCVSDCRRSSASNAPAVRRELNSNIAATYKVAYATSTPPSATPRTSSTRSSGSTAAPPIRSKAAASSRNGVPATAVMTIWASTQKAHGSVPVADRAARLR
jgi:carbon-monoxide dehydrogenase large subunit